MNFQARLDAVDERVVLATDAGSLQPKPQEPLAKDPPA